MKELNTAQELKKNNITAFQFHPEKSGIEGIKIYRNWSSEIQKNKEKI